MDSDIVPFPPARKLVVDAGRLTSRRHVVYVKLYRFMIWVGDDNPDACRIKIWHEEGGVEHLVCDNDYDQSSGGGSPPACLSYIIGLADPQPIRR